MPESSGLVVVNTTPIIALALIPYSPADEISSSSPAE
jgi:hypothetical protein